MATKRRCIYGMQNFTVDNLIKKAKLIQDQLSAPEYVTIVPTPSEVMTLINQLSDAQSQCSKHNYQGIPVRNQLRTQLEDMLRFQCVAVNALAKGNLVLLSRSGFDLNKEQGKRPVPEQGRISSFKPLEQEGKVKIFYSGIKGRDYYEIRAVSIGFEQTVISTKPYAFIDNLPLGQEIKITYRAVNPNGEGMWSPNIDCLLMPNTLGSLQRFLDSKK